MKAEDYHASPGLSNSMMTKLLKSPAHLKYYMDNPDPPTPAMILGEQVHTMLLEPENANFVKAPGDRRTKEGKAQYQALLDEGYEPKDMIKSDTYDQIERMVASVMSHPFASQIINSAKDGGGIEESLFWHQPIHEDKDGGWYDGIDCKARVDIVPSQSSMFNDSLVDFKTTIDASPEAFAKSVFNFGYYRQAAHYLHGWNNVHDEYRDKFIIIACEKTPPFACAVYELDNGSIELGGYEVARLRAWYAECVDNDDWPSYGKTIHTLELPAWATPQIG